MVAPAECASTVHRMTENTTAAPAPTTRITPWLREFADALDALTGAVAALRRLMGEVAGLLLGVVGLITVFLALTGH